MVRDPGQTLRRSWTTCRPRSRWAWKLGKRGDPERGGPAVNAAGIVRAEYDPAPSRAGVVGHTRTSYELWNAVTKAQKERAKAGLAITGAALTIVGKRRHRHRHQIRVARQKDRRGRPQNGWRGDRRGGRRGVRQRIFPGDGPVLVLGLLGAGYNVRMETIRRQLYRRDDVYGRRAPKVLLLSGARPIATGGALVGHLSHIQPGVPNLSVLELTETSVTLVWTNVGAAMKSKTATREHAGLRPGHGSMEQQSGRMQKTQRP